MKNIKLVFTGYKFPVAEEIARRFESQCSSKNFVLKQSSFGFEKSKCFDEEEITFDFEVEVEGKKQCSFHFADALNYHFSKLNIVLPKSKCPVDKYPKGGIIPHFITDKGVEEIKVKDGFAEDFNAFNEKMFKAIEFNAKMLKTIGLLPEKIWQEQRLKSINEAVERYTKENQSIPFEWIRERNELLEKIHGNKAAT